MPAKDKTKKNNTKPAPVEQVIVDSTQGPQLNDSAIGTPQWSTTMHKTKQDVDEIQAGSCEQESPSAEQPEKEENGLTMRSGGYFQRKLTDFQEKMVDAQARWANSLEEMERIMEEDCQDAEKVTTILRKRQNDRRKEWKRALDIDL
jgi:hypothetical protein